MNTIHLFDIETQELHLDSGRSIRLNEVSNIPKDDMPEVIANWAKAYGHIGQNDVVGVFA